LYGLAAAFGDQKLDEFKGRRSERVIASSCKEYGVWLGGLIVHQFRPEKAAGSVSSDAIRWRNTVEADGASVAAVGKGFYFANRRM